MITKTVLKIPVEKKCENPVTVPCTISSYIIVNFSILVMKLLLDYFHYKVNKKERKKKERETCVPCGLIATCTQTMRDIQPNSMFGCFRKPSVS